MIKLLKRKYHYHVAMFWCSIHRVAVKRFHYHEDKHRKIAVDWGNEDAE